MRGKQGYISPNCESTLPLRGAMRSVNVMASRNADQSSTIATQCAGGVDDHLPERKMSVVSFTFDVDAEAGWLGEGEEYSRRLTILLEGRYGVTRGVPHILDLLARHNIPGTFFIYPVTAQHHPGLVEKKLKTGHEIAHHGYLHLRSDQVEHAGADRRD